LLSLGNLFDTFGSNDRSSGLDSSGLVVGNWSGSILDLGTKVLNWDRHSQSSLDVDHLRKGRGKSAESRRGDEGVTHLDRCRVNNLKEEVDSWRVPVETV